MTFEDANGGSGSEAGGAEAAVGRGKLAGILEKGGEVLASVLAFEELLDLFGFVDLGVGAGDGRARGGGGDAFLEEVGQHALGAIAATSGAGAGEVFGEAGVVEIAVILQFGDHLVHRGRVGGAGGEFAAEFAGGEGAAHEQADGIVLQGGGIERRGFLAKGHGRGLAETLFCSRPSNLRGLH